MNVYMYMHAIQIHTYLYICMDHRPVHVPLFSAQGSCQARTKVLMLLCTWLRFDVLYVCLFIACPFVLLPSLWGQDSTTMKLGILGMVPTNWLIFSGFSVPLDSPKCPILTAVDTKLRGLGARSVRTTVHYFAIRVKLL